VTLLKKDATNTGLFSFNYGPTQTPALALLNVSPTKATLYTSNTPFILAIPSLFDSSGQTSLGIDVSPAFALQSATHLITVEDYESAGSLGRLWYRLRVELAGTSGAASTTPSKIAPSGIALGLSSSLWPSSDPITARLSDQPDPTKSYFQECVSPTNPKGRTLAQRIDAANVDILNGYWSDFGIELGRLQTIRDARGTPAADDALEHAPAILAAYRAEKVTDGPTLTSPARTASKAVDEATALSELKDLLQKDAAANAGNAARVQADNDAIGAIEDIAADHVVLTPTATPLPQEQADVAAWLAAMKTPGLAARQLRRIAQATPVLQGVPPTADAPATAAEKADVITLANYKGDEFLKELGALKNKDEKGYSTKAVAKIYADLDITKDLTTCVQAATLVANTAFDITGGIGLVEAGKAGALQNLYPGGQTVWLGFRAPLWRSFNAATPASDLGGDSSKAAYILAGGSLVYQRNSVLVTGNATTPLIRADVSGVWFGLEGFTPKFRGGAQVGYTDTHAVMGSQSSFSTNGFRWETSVGYQIFSGTWLSLSYGTARGSTTKLDDRTALVTLQFSPPPAASLFGKAASN